MALHNTLQSVIFILLYYLYILNFAFNKGGRNLNLLFKVKDVIHNVYLLILFIIILCIPSIQTFVWANFAMQEVYFIISFIIFILNLTQITRFSKFLFMIKDTSYKILIFFVHNGWFTHKFLQTNEKQLFCKQYKSRLPNSVFNKILQPKCKER